MITLRSLPFALLFSLLPACQQGPCAGDVCECRGGDRCDFSCGAVPGCDVTCESLVECDGTCGDGCTATCNSLSNCLLGCGDGCALDCTSASRCELDCGADCDFSCTSTATCVVRMISGVARCTSVGGCDARCVLPDGSTEAATECGGGVFACGPCP